MSQDIFRGCQCDDIFDIDWDVGVVKSLLYAPRLTGQANVVDISVSHLSASGIGQL